MDAKKSPDKAQPFMKTLLPQKESKRPCNQSVPASSTSVFAQTARMQKSCDFFKKTRLRSVGLGRLNIF